MSKFKKIFAAVMAAATVSALSVGVFAVDEYKNAPFNFNLGKNSTAYSPVVFKQDSLDYAMANCKEGNIDSKAYVWLSVCKYNTDARVTNERRW